MGRRYSEHEVDEYVLADQMRRADAVLRERQGHPERWELVTDPEWPEFGLVWREKE